jgi:hypothetical protein
VYLKCKQLSTKTDLLNTNNMSGAGDSGEFVQTVLLNRYLKLVVGRGPEPRRSGTAPLRQTYKAIAKYSDDLILLRGAVYKLTVGPVHSTCDLTNQSQNGC